MTWWRDVHSSMVSEIGYDAENQELLVKWARGGKVSAYQGVDEAKADELSKAPSVGQMIESEIKPYHSHRYV
jgi:hypothetical protein